MLILDEFHLVITTIEECDNLLGKLLKQELIKIIEGRFFLYNRKMLWYRALC